MIREHHANHAMQPTYTPEHLERWSPVDPAFGSIDNYTGADLSAFYLAPVSISRDTADSVSLSNWRTITADLERLAQSDQTGITRMGHWACGWYEIFLIHESDTAALKAADQWAADLEGYPVADESDLAELQQEEEEEAWERWGMTEWRETMAKALEPYAPDTADNYWETEQIERLSDDEAGAAWVLVADRLSWCCVHESDGPTFNFEEAAERLDTATLAQITGLPLLAPDQEWRREPYPWPDGSTDPLAPALA